MAGGGTWTAQNKRRPGAYINFISVPKPVGTLGDRGVMACALPMTWGPNDTLIEVTGDELINGNSLLKVGCTAFDTDASLPFRVALSGCYKGLFFRSDTGGNKASAVLETNKLTVTAKYAGTTGNKLSVTTVANVPSTGLYTVYVLFNSVKKEEFIVSTLNDFKTLTSSWIDFVVAASPPTQTVPATAGTALTGGTNGTVTTAVYTAFMNLLDTATWQCMAINTTDASVPALVTAKIKTLRDSRGKKVQAVVYNDASADYEGIISVKQGFKTATDTVGVDLFPLWVASMTAGSAINYSNTARVVENAISITNPVAEDDIPAGLMAGWFLLTYRQDGAVCVEQDINCLKTFTTDKGKAFSKNRVIRCLDEIGNNTALIFNRNYCGRVSNNSVGRDNYKSELIAMVNTLQNINAVQNFNGASDIIVLQGADIDSVVVDLTIQPVDSMEKLYMVVNVDA